MTKIQDALQKTVGERDRIRRESSMRPVQFSDVEYPSLMQPSRPIIFHSAEHNEGSFTYRVSRDGTIELTYNNQPYVAGRNQDADNLHAIVGHSARNILQKLQGMQGYQDGRTEHAITLSVRQ